MCRHNICDSNSYRSKGMAPEQYTQKQVPPTFLGLAVHLSKPFRTTLVINVSNLFPVISALAKLAAFVPNKRLFMSKPFLALCDAPTYVFAPSLNSRPQALIITGNACQGVGTNTPA
jgi:hypothetical protein